MAKYSTGGGGSDAGETCELCGAANSDLELVNVAGAKLSVCPNCAQHDDRQNTAGSGSDGGGGKQDEGPSREKRAAQNAARIQDAAKNDPSHWEGGADYDDDQLPYLVDDYGERMTDARQNAGFQLGELAAELEVDEADLLAIEQGRATQAGVGGSLVGAVENALDVDLVDER